MELLLVEFVLLCVCVGVCEGGERNDQFVYKNGRWKKYRQEMIKLKCTKNPNLWHLKAEFVVFGAKECFQTMNERMFAMPVKGHARASEFKDVKTNQRAAL